MKFPYYKVPLEQKSDFFGTSLLKPIIPVGIRIANKGIRYAALIDSGADFCIFHAEVGEQLGVDIRRGSRYTFGGIQPGNASEVFLHEVILNIGGWDYKTVVGFSYGIAPSGYGVLGQRGFFDKFSIRFDLAKEEIELKERR